MATDIDELKCMVKDILADLVELEAICNRAFVGENKIESYGGKGYTGQIMTQSYRCMRCRHYSEVETWDLIPAEKLICKHPTCNRGRWDRYQERKEKKYGNPDKHESPSNRL